MKKQYVIKLRNNDGVFYIFGGTFCMHGQRYAKLTELISEAKCYGDRSHAINSLNRLTYKCVNLNPNRYIYREIVELPNED